MTCGFSQCTICFGTDGCACILGQCGRMRYEVMSQSSDIITQALQESFGEDFGLPNAAGFDDKAVMKQDMVGIPAVYCNILY